MRSRAQALRLGPQPVTLPGGSQAAAQKRALKKAEQDRRQDLVDRVNAMDEQSLRDFAKSTYQQEIDGRVHDMAKLREKVIGFVDQFGFE